MRGTGSIMIYLEKFSKEKKEIITSGLKKYIT